MAKYKVTADYKTGNHRVSCEVSAACESSAIGKAVVKLYGSSHFFSENQALTNGGSRRFGQVFKKRRSGINVSVTPNIFFVVEEA